MNEKDIFESGKDVEKRGYLINFHINYFHLFYVS